MVDGRFSGSVRNVAARRMTIARRCNAGLLSGCPVWDGRSRTTKPRPARQSIRFPAGANVAQAFGHDAQAWEKYQCRSHAWIFKGTGDNALSKSSAQRMGAGARRPGDGMNYIQLAENG